MFVIADIAGEFDALMRLVSRFPEDERIVLVGDLVDRGPKSNEVVEWARKTSRVTALMGNHEHMMLDHWHGGKIYSPGIWQHNGGDKTIQSYRSQHNQTGRPPESHLTYLASLDSYYFSDDKKLLVTHAPVCGGFEPQELAYIESPLDPLFDLSLLWNRRPPIRREYFQVFGHNSHWGLRTFEDNGEAWGICIDQSQKKILTAFHWPSGEVLEEPYDFTYAPLSGYCG
jgi:hypothetical protein